MITELDIAHQRLFNQHLAGNSFEKPEEVVNWLGAVQAQDYAGAKWALGLRLQDAMDSEIDRAFNDGVILRTHLMRPTWHFVTPTDIRWLLALTAPRVHALNATYYRKAGLDGELFKRSNAALVKALQGGVQLTRDELRVVLQGAGVPTEGELRMSYLMMQAELEGIVCSGARRGKQFTYALLDERAPHAKILEREQALAELAGRYFTSRGPSTVQDFAKWSGLTIADARSGLEAAKRQLREEVVDGRSYWLPASSPTVEVVAPTALLLSIYDEYISGYKDRSAIIDEELGVRLMAMGNALYYVVVVDGRILGTWNRTLKKEAVIIEMRLFTELTETKNLALAAAARRYGQFLGLPVVLA